MATFWKIIGVIAAIIVLRLCGIPWFWAMASVVGVVWSWSYLHTIFPSHKGKISLAIVALLLVAVIPFLRGYTDPYTWRSEEAGVRRLLFWDMWRAQKMDPAMLKSRLELSSQHHWLENQIGTRHEHELALIRQDRASGRITDAEAWNRTQKVMNETAMFQQKAATVSSRIISSNPVPHYPVCANAQNYKFGANQDSIQIPIQPDCWSGWIVLPTDSTGTVSLYKWWGVHSPAELELMLADGHRISMEADEVSSGLILPYHRFRLRGPGPAIVKIER